VKVRLLLGNSRGVRYPLRALWQHPPYFHDGSAATLADVVTHYIGSALSTLKRISSSTSSSISSRAEREAGRLAA